MATRRRKSGQFKRQTSRRRSKPKLSLSNSILGVVTANAVTQGVFGTNVGEFLTQGWGKTNFAGSHTTSITLPDLFERMLSGGSTGMINSSFPNVQDSIKANLSREGAMMVAQIIGYPILFGVAMKVLRKPIILPLNRTLKNIGLDVKA